MALKKHSLRHVVETFYSTAWAIDPEKLDQMAELVEHRSSGEAYTEDEIRLRIAGRRGEAARPYEMVEGGVAVIGVYGVLAAKMNLMSRISGGTSYQQLAAAIRQAASDESVKAVVLDVDSPGGDAAGVAEVAEAIRALREDKPVLAVANNEMASGAYWIGSAASEVIATATASVGSIGVYGVHADASKAYEKMGVTYTLLSAGKYKAAANPYSPLTPERRKVLQEKIDDIYGLFLAEVAANRGTTAEAVARDYGQGKSMLAERALASGLIDRIATLADVLGELQQTRDTVTITLSDRREEETVMDPKIMQALQKMGLISGDDTKEAAQAALRAWFKARSQDVPDTDEKILAALEEKPKAAADPPPAPPPTPKAADPPPVATLESVKTSDEDLKKARAEERQRIADIRARGELLGVDGAVIEAAIDGGTSVPDFLDQATKQLTKKEEPVGRIQSGAAADDKFHASAVEALVRRGVTEFDPYEGKPVSEGAKALEYHSMIEMARESFRMTVGRCPIGDPNDIAAAALGDPDARYRLFAADVPYQTPGDFPNILSAAANKMLEAAPRYVDTTFQVWASRKPSVPDFKPSTLVRYGEFGEFPLHVDGDNFEQSELAEDYSWIQTDSYGDEFGLTPVMMVNDDLGAFMEALMDKQAAHDQTLNSLCVGLLTGNADAADGVALFHEVTHGNDAAGATPSQTQLSAMRLQLRKQKGVGAKRKIRQTLKLLLIPEDLETTVQVLLQATVVVVPTAASSGEIFRGNVNWLVEPILSDHSTAYYYGFGDTARLRPIVYCYQRGFEGMRRRNYFNPQNNCRIFQFEGRFAAAINNYRGVCRNKGGG